MTKVEVTYGASDLTLIAEGHATGNPAVCAGVSVLLYTLANWILDCAHNEGWPEAACRTEIGEGRACLRMPATRDGELVFRAIGNGLALLVAADPAALYVRLKEEDTRRAKGPDLAAFGEPAEGAAAGPEAPLGEPPVGNAVLSVPSAASIAGETRNAGDGVPYGTEAGGGDDAAGTTPPKCGPACPHAGEDDAAMRASRPTAASPVGHAVPGVPRNAEDSVPYAEDADPAPDPAALAAERHARAAAFAAARCRSWLAEAETLQKRCPDFDLAALAHDRVFTLLLAGGVPMEAAYRAADVEGTARRAAAEARRDLAERIRANALRPTEAGAASQPAFALRPDPNRLDEGQVRDVLARLDRRERVSFG